MFIDAIVSSTIVVILIIVVIVVVITVEESTVVIVSGSALLEFDGISRNPRHIVVIVVVELTGLRKDHGTEFGVCCNVVSVHEVDRAFFVE